MTVVIVNEVLQWAAIGGLAFFLTGAYRLIAVRPASGVLSLDRSVGPKIATPLPSMTANALDNLPSEKPVLIVFVKQNCPACGGLMAKLAATTVRHDGVSVAVVITGAAETYVQVLGADEVGDLIVNDADGSIASECDVHATPLQVLVAPDRTVLEKRVSSDPTELLELALMT